MHEATLSAVEPQLLLPLFGPCDQHLRRVREAFGVAVTHREGNIIHVAGEEAAVAGATEALEAIKRIVERHRSISEAEVDEVVARVQGRSNELQRTPIDIIQAGHRVEPRTAGQAKYVEAIRKHDLIFSVGPAGTGKTYLAVAMAVESLKHEELRKIVLVRPAVEAGERLGYLPGDLQAKINPYLRPLLDALNEMVDHDQISRLMNNDIIEVIPLAYMRGRTLNDAFIILDEAQNTSVSQMKMFLTRMGAGSKIVVSGDDTQVDLPHHAKSGLRDAVSRLRGIKGVSIVNMTKADIVRHRLVRDIVQAYDEGHGNRRR